MVLFNKNNKNHYNKKVNLNKKDLYYHQMLLLNYNLRAVSHVDDT